MAPAWRMAARKTASSVPRAPVWDSAARAPASERPVLVTITGIVGLAARMAAANSAPSVTDSASRHTMRVPGS